MFPPPVVRAGPGERPSPNPGRVDRLRVAAPWAWTGLWTAITVLDGTLRDWVSGAAPSLYSTATPNRDPRGGSVLTFSGAAAQQQEFAHTGHQAMPATALTVYCRWKPSGVSPAQAGLFSKPYATTTPFTTWNLSGSGGVTNAATMFGGLSIGTTNTTTANSAALGTALFTNAWIRWSTGTTITLDTFRDDGTIAVAQVASTTSPAGTLAYPAAVLPIRVGNTDSPTRASYGGDFSIGMVWNRKLSDQEIRAVTGDPFGFLRRA